MYFWFVPNTVAIKYLFRLLYNTIFFIYTVLIFMPPQDVQQRHYIFTVTHCLSRAITHMLIARLIHIRMSPKMMWILYLVGVYHFSKFHKNRAVTSLEMLINPLNPILCSGEDN